MRKIVSYQEIIARTREDDLFKNVAGQILEKQSPGSKPPANPSNKTMLENTVRHAPKPETRQTHGTISRTDIFPSDEKHYKDDAFDTYIKTNLDKIKSIFVDPKADNLVIKSGLTIANIREQFSDAPVSLVNLLVKARARAAINSDGTISRADLLPAYNQYLTALEHIFVDITANNLLIKPSVTIETIKAQLQDAPEELIDMLVYARGIAGIQQEQIIEVIRNDGTFGTDQDKKGWNKAPNYNFELLGGRSPMEGVKDLAKIMLQKYRYLKGDVSFQVIFEREVRDHLKNIYAAYLGNQDYRGVNYPFYDELEAFAKDLDSMVASEPGFKAGLLMDNPDKADKAHNDTRYMETMFRELVRKRVQADQARVKTEMQSDAHIVDEYQQQIDKLAKDIDKLKQEFESVGSRIKKEELVERMNEIYYQIADLVKKSDYQYTVYFARETLLRELNGSFFQQLDKDNDKRYMTDEAISMYKLNTDGEIVFNEMSSLHGTQGMTSPITNRFGMATQQDMKDAQSGQFTKRGNLGMLEAQGCGNIFLAINGSYSKIYRTILDIQTKQVKPVKSADYGKLAMTSVTATAMTAGIAAAVQTVISLLGLSVSPVALGAGSLTTALLFLSTNNYFKNMLRAQIRIKEGTDEPLEITRVQQRLEFLAYETTIEDYDMLPAIALSMSMSEQIRTPIFIVGAEGNLEVSEGQRLRWDTTKLNTALKTFPLYAEIAEKMIKEQRLSPEVFKDLITLFEKEIKNNEYPTSTIKTLKYAMTLAVYSALGFSPFNFGQGSFLTSLFGQQAAMAASGASGLAGYLVIMRTILKHRFNIGDDYNKYMDTVKRWTYLTMSLQDAIRGVELSLSLLDFNTTKPVEFAYYRDYLKSVLKFNELDDYWGRNKSAISAALSFPELGLEQQYGLKPGLLRGALLKYFIDNGYLKNNKIAEPTNKGFDPNSPIELKVDGKAIVIGSGKIERAELKAVMDSHPGNRDAYEAAFEKIFINYDEDGDDPYEFRPGMNMSKIKSLLGGIAMSDDIRNILIHSLDASVREVINKVIYSSTIDREKIPEGYRTSEYFVNPDSPKLLFKNIGVERFGAVLLLNTKTDTDKVKKGVTEDLKAMKEQKELLSRMLTADMEDNELSEADKEALKKRIADVGKAISSIDAELQRLAATDSKIGLLSAAEINKLKEIGFLTGSGNDLCVNLWVKARNGKESGKFVAGGNVLMIDMLETEGGFTTADAVRIYNLLNRSCAESILNKWLTVVNPNHKLKTTAERNSEFKNLRRSAILKTSGLVALVTTGIYSASVVLPFVASLFTVGAAAATVTAVGTAVLALMVFYWAVKSAKDMYYNMKSYVKNSILSINKKVSDSVKEAFKIDLRPVKREDVFPKYDGYKDALAKIFDDVTNEKAGQLFFQTGMNKQKVKEILGPDAPKDLIKLLVRKLN